MTTQNQDRYKTILVIVIGLLILSIITKLRVLSGIALGIGLLSLISAFIAKWIEWGWLKLAFVLGWINSRILLSLLYFLFLLPIALVARIFTKDPLKLKGKTDQSLFATRDHQYKKEDLENIW